MEIEENHRNRKRSRVGNGNQAAAKLDDDEDDGDQNKELRISNNNSSSSNRMRPWHHPSSRIFRVSRASGGKDRHSKVFTAKGLRDRRVRLSVSTAIQFYDLQDRLGYDQPSKAIEWLIKAADSAIAELPSLDTTFPEPPLELQQQPKQLAIEKAMPSDSGIDPEADPSYNQQQHSSASETSKGSVLSLSRSESRVKARERARERVKEKDRDEAQVVSHHQTLDPSLNSQGSFTKLLTGGSSSSTAVSASSTADFIHNHLHSLPPVTSTTDYFGIQPSLLGQQQQRQQKSTHQISSAGFSSQAHFGNSSPIGMVPLFTNAGDHPTTEMQQFAFDHFFPVATATASTGGGGGDYSLNFSISPSLAGFHRGTLQSNSTPHHHHHHHQLQLSHHHQVQAQRYSSALDGSSVPFFFGAPATTTTAGSHSENPYSSASGFDGYKHLHLNGKGKN